MALDDEIQALDNMRANFIEEMCNDDVIDWVIVNFPNEVDEITERFDRHEISAEQAQNEFLRLYEFRRTT